MTQKIIQGLFIFLLCSSVSYITVTTFEKPTLYSTENRPMTARPAWPQHIKDIEPFIQEIEAWWSDAIHFRSKFIKTYNTGRAMLGIYPQKEVVIGKDGWLFAGESSIEDYRNARLFTEDELQHWKNYLLYRHYDAEKNGAVYVFIAIPNKERIYGEYLPDNFSQLSSTTRFDQIIDAMRNTPVHILDLRPALLAAKKQNIQTYTKTDTHWNYLGANIAQYEILNYLQKFYPDIPARLIPLADYSYGIEADFQKTGLAYSGNGLNRILGLLDAYLDEREPMLREPLPGIECVQPGTFSLPDMYQSIVGAHRDQLFQAETCDTGKHRVMMFRDSFTSLMKPQLSSTFQSIFYIWKARPAHASDWQYFMASQKPDIVLDALVERYLIQVPRSGESYPADFDATPYSSVTP